MKIKAILSGVLLFIAFIANAQQFDVTSPDNSGPGTLRQAIDDAMAYANTGAGQEATISFKVPTGLCQITAPLPPVNITVGAIKFINSFLYPLVVQGVNKSLTYNTLIFKNTGSTSSIIIKDLKFVTHLSDTIISVSTADNVTIKNCVFEGAASGINGFSIYMSSSKNFLIESNIFNEGNGGIKIGDNYNMTNVDILNNTFNTASGVSFLLVTENSIGKVTIQGNVFTDNNMIYINHEGSGPDKLSNLTVKNNTFTNCSVAFLLSGTLPYWVFENNTINLADYGMAFQAISRSLSVDGGIMGLRLVNENSLNYTPFNQGNKIYLNSPIPDNSFNASIYLYGRFTHDKCLIIGYDLPKSIYIPGTVFSYPVIIRETKIKTLMKDKPIWYLNEDDIYFGGPKKPTLVSSTISGNTISISYKLNNFKQENGDFILDFYASNENGDLLNYMGNQTVTTLTGGTYTVTLPFVTLPGRIAVTATSNGGPVGNVQLGTSAAAYLCPNGGASNVSIAITSGTNPTCSGAPITFTATPSDGTYHPTYQWKLNGSAIHGATSSTYTAIGHLNGSVITCEMKSNDACSILKTTTSNEISIAVSNQDSYIGFLPDQPCAGTPVNFFLLGSVPALESTSASAADDAIWDFGDGISSTESTHIYTASGTYTVTYSYTIGDCPILITAQITVKDCQNLECKDCVGSFAPIPGEKYVISAWVQESNGKKEITYAAPAIKITFLDGTSNVLEVIDNIKGKGQIIDDWQRIEQEFVINSATAKIKIDLINTAEGKDVYFDDIRIHPFNSNLKSFVYDPVTLRLSAELDANNYATFYEYDEDGALVRVKKETERGIVTVKETRNNTKK